MYRTLHLMTAEYTLFSRTLIIFTKIAIFRAIKQVSTYFKKTSKFSQSMFFGFSGLSFGSSSLV